MADTDFVELRVDGAEEEMPNAPEIGGVNAGEVNGNPQSSFNPNFNGAPDVLSFGDIMNRFDAPSGISDDGRAFLADLTAELSDPVRNSRQVPWGKMKVIQLSQPNDTHAVVCDNNAVILIMAESNDYDADLPTIHLEYVAADSLHAIYPDAKILTVVVVSPNDYGNSKGYATNIRNAFLYSAEPQVLKISSLYKDTFLTFSDNPVEYDAAYRRLSPHSVQLRRDFTLVIYNQSRANGPAGNWTNQSAQNFDERSMYFARANMKAREPVATIGGYMEFARGDNIGGINKLIPFMHISEIHSKVVSDAIIQMCIMAFTKRFIISGLWKAYYLNHTQDIHKNAVDIGWLLPDGNGGRCKISDVNNFNSFLANYCEPVQLVLDRVDGRFAIPGIWKYTSEDVNVIKEVLDTTVQFLEGRVDEYQGAGIPFQVTDAQYRGTYRFGDKVLDTAYIDFMGEYPRHPTEAIRCEKLLLRKNNPMLALADQREFEPDLKLLYRTSVVSFNPEYIGWLDKNMPFINTAYVQQQTGYAAVEPLIANARRWGNYTSAPNGGNYSTGTWWNPGDYIYRR